jgi:hypothetical protein
VTHLDLLKVLSWVESAAFFVATCSCMRHIGYNITFAECYVRSRSPRWFTHGAETSSRRFGIWSGTFSQELFLKSIFLRGGRPRSTKGTIMNWVH